MKRRSFYRGIVLHLRLSPFPVRAIAFSGLVGLLVLWPASELHAIPVQETGAKGVQGAPSSTPGVVQVRREIATFVGVVFTATDEEHLSYGNHFIRKAISALSGRTYPETERFDPASADANNDGVVDIIRFTPSALGATTAGTWSFYFDGSDVGLTGSNEDVDALEILSDGSLVISTTGNPDVLGLSSLTSQDLIRFGPASLGARTTGTWSYYYDGSDVGMAGSGENVDAVAWTSTASLLLSTTGTFSVPGVSGGDEDVLGFAPTGLGSTTSGTYQMYLHLSTKGIATSANVNAMAIVQ